MEQSATAPTLFQVFDVIQNVSRLREGRALYGPQAKKAVLESFPGFSERDFGYRKFVELLQAGNDAGRFRLSTEGGHPHIFPIPEEEATRIVSSARLRTDLWDTLVSWEDGMRFWDLKRKRAIFVPVDEGGAPLWETSPRNFVKIDAISMDEQIGWMREFANEQDDANRGSLLAALGDVTPGAFKRRLGELKLTAAWRTKLSQKVMEHAVDWATRSELSPISILEKSKARPTHTSSAPADHGLKVPNEMTPTDQLRLQLHGVIERMTLGELSAIQIPAHYLLER